MLVAQISYEIPQVEHFFILSEYLMSLVVDSILYDQISCKISMIFTVTNRVVVLLFSRSTLIFKEPHISHAKSPSPGANGET